MIVSAKEAMEKETHLQKELENLKIIVLKMAALMEKSLEKAIKSFFERDEALAQKVIDNDEVINELELTVDNICLKMLALEQPVAADLRFVMGVMKIIAEIERIADQSVNIAERTIHLAQRPPLPPLPALESLADIAIDMVRMVISAFSNENTEQAQHVCDMDNEADEQNVRVLKSLMNYMVENHEKPAIVRAVQTIIVGRCLERAADLATNIAESVIFIVKGYNIKHKCQK